jgi:hypothetical protein
MSSGLHLPLESPIPHQGKLIADAGVMKYQRQFLAHSFQMGVRIYSCPRQEGFNQPSFLHDFLDFNRDEGRFFQ